MKIGLTGGIASGKSTAASYLEQLGAFVIDADKLGHRVYEPQGPAFRAVVEAFGDDIVVGDGAIDRKVLGGKVFGDPDGLRRLTDIVWPEILDLARREMDAVERSDPARIIVLEAAVLLEAGWDVAVDEVWALLVAPEIAVERACARDGLSAEEVRRRMAAQLGNEERRARAHVVIDNSGGPETLLARLDREWLRITGNDGRAAGGQAG